MIPRAAKIYGERAVYFLFFFSSFFLNFDHIDDPNY